ncbi:uncharacterized protein PAC_05034 [Phialocephala subalpina]|uniref:Uncharacterized protein n=1 Tax=Phialocephala subalpina TaxID=576137 RepID=A0A1L7WQV2_9HELO|nr:uncharacterized protein PAC_05034 [Phialocephala subalpina]
MQRINAPDGYHVSRSTHRPRTWGQRYPFFGTSGARGPPSDVPNSEDSEIAPGDLVRDTYLNSDRYSHIANAGGSAGIDAGVGEVLEVRPAIKTVDVGNDTSLDGHSTTTGQPSHHKQPQNEILYLQKHNNGSTRVVRKPGVLPMVCYVDASTNITEDQAVDGGLKELEGAMSKLKIKEPPAYRIRARDIDDFDQEG